MAERAETPRAERPRVTHRRKTSRWQDDRFRIGALAVIAFVSAVLVWSLATPHHAGSPIGSARATAATGISASRLTSLAASSGAPIYWAGAKAGFTIEYTRTASGRVYVRYLPPGVAAGSPYPYLTIGTYPLGNAYTVSKTLSQRPGAVTIPLTGAVAFYDSSARRNVYLAYPGSDHQIEVYDPSSGAARSLVASGSVVQVASAAPTTATIHPTARTTL